jgi:hypothetical protein
LEIKLVSIAILKHIHPCPIISILPLGEDPCLNLCDLFVFAGPEATTVLVMTVNPDARFSSPSEPRDEGL